MGTNYYWRYDDCRCCERYEEKHIGKRSGGWEFCFRGYRDDSSDPGETIVSWADWKARLLTSGGILDEYGTPIPVGQFIEMVEKEAGPGVSYTTSTGPRTLLNHIDAILSDSRYESSWPSYRDTTKHWKDSQGYAFSAGEFS